MQIKNYHFDLTSKQKQFRMVLVKHKTGSIFHGTNENYLTDWLTMQFFHNFTFNTEINICNYVSSVQELH